MSTQDEVLTHRKSYERGALDESMLDANPIAQFQIWMQDALDAGIVEPNAMALATATASAAPNVRYVLLRGFDERGFRFFTNLESSKASELAANARASVAFYWRELERQVRLGGAVEPLSREESETYFSTRPRGHQLAAWASRQSAPVDSRLTLEEALADAGKRFPDTVPLPPFWGGYRLTPDWIEFWQGRKNRLHDRFRYHRLGASWRLERLGP
jgi:pyridoxamine 5'-phosphate oxidase